TVGISPCAGWAHATATHVQRGEEPSHAASRRKALRSLAQTTRGSRGGVGQVVGCRIAHGSAIWMTEREWPGDE
ncbi:MAG TPA: hypothetical protein V6C97_07765, partial [Oculatellaceae cyanobacterium]